MFLSERQAPEGMARDYYLLHVEKYSYLLQRLELQ